MIDLDNPLKLTKTNTTRNLRTPGFTSHWLKQNITNTQLHIEDRIYGIA